MTAYEIDPYAVPGPSPFGPAAGPLHVPSLTNDEREALLNDLELWVAQLVRRFNIDHRTIPPCWGRHNGMLESLVALRDHERASFSDNSSPAAAVDWLRALRDITGLLRDLAALTMCSGHEHRAEVTRAEPRSGGAPILTGAPEQESLP